MNTRNLLSHPYEPRRDGIAADGCAFCGKPQEHEVHAAKLVQKSEAEIVEKVKP